MKLVTDRLVLRDYARSDVEAVHEFASDPKTVTFVDWGPNTLVDTHEFLDNCIAEQAESPRTRYTLAVWIGHGERVSGPRRLGLFRDAVVKELVGIDECVRSPVHKGDGLWVRCELVDSLDVASRVVAEHQSIRNKFHIASVTERSDTS